LHTPQSNIYIIKEFVHPKRASATGNFLSGKREGAGGGERERKWGGRAGQQAAIFKVRLGLGDIEGRDRVIE
jgi:hypothetical protein